MDPSSPFVHPDVPIELDSPPGRRPKVSLSVLLAHIREKRDPILDVIYNSPTRSVATTCSFSHDADNPGNNSRRSSRRFSSFLVTSTSAKNRHRLSSTWSQSDSSDEDSYALLSAVTASSISSTTRRSIGGTAVKKRLKNVFDPDNNNNNHSSSNSNANGAKARSTSLGDGKPPDDPDITTYRASSLGALNSSTATPGSGSIKSSRKPSLHLASDGPPVLPPLSIFSSGKRRNSSLGSLGFSSSSRRRSSQNHQLQQLPQHCILIDAGPPPRPPPLMIPNKGDVGCTDTHLRKKRPRAFMPVSPREVYLRLYGDDGGGGLACDDASGGMRTKFDDSSGGIHYNGDNKGGNDPPPSSYPLPVRTDMRKGSASSQRRKSSKRGSDSYQYHLSIPSDKRPSIGAGTPGPGGGGRRRGSGKHSQHRKKSLQSCWFDDDDNIDISTATEESDMDLDLLGPLSPPAFSKKKKGAAGSRLTPSKRSAENINLFDPFFSFSRRCVTAPIRSIGPLDNWLSDTLHNNR